MSNIIIFSILAILMVISGVLAVTAKKTLRAVVFLLFVLLGTAGLYILLNYHFLGMVQMAVYAGGVIVLFIFAVMLVNERADTKMKAPALRKVLIGVCTSIVGFAIVTFVVLKTKFLYSGELTLIGDQEIDMSAIGTALMGTGKHQYLLSFEILSIMLLACAIGGIVIARKR